MCTSGDVWHVAVDGLPSSGIHYALRVIGDGGWETGYRWDKSRLLLDPRAPLVAGRKVWGKREAQEEFQLDVSVGPQMTKFYMLYSMYFVVKDITCCRLAPAQPCKQSHFCLACTAPACDV